MWNEIVQMLLSFLVRVLSWFGLSFGTALPSENPLSAQESQKNEDEIIQPATEPQPFSALQEGAALP